MENKEEPLIQNETNVSELIRLYKESEYFDATVIDSIQDLSFVSALATGIKRNELLGLLQKFYIRLAIVVITDFSIMAATLEVKENPSEHEIKKLLDMYSVVLFFKNIFKYLFEMGNVEPRKFSALKLAEKIFADYANKK